MAEKGQGIASGALNAVIKPVADIARELGLKERRVNYILQKGKRRLRKALLKGGILL